MSEFKLIPVKREIEIQRDIMRYLQNERRVKWFCRLNSGGARHSSGRLIHFYSLALKSVGITHQGYSDLHGMLEGGRYFALEVKTSYPNKPKPTEHQAQFIKAVQDGGGIAAVVTSWEEAKHALFK